VLSSFSLFHKIQGDKSPDGYSRSPSNVMRSSAHSPHEDFVPRRQGSSNKRRYSESNDYDEQDEYRKRKPSSVVPLFSRFSVDIIESSADHLMLKVRLNDAVFEGVLECSERGLKCSPGRRE